MTIQYALNILKTYPFVDIDKEGETIRKQVKSEDVTAELLNSYLSAHKKIELVPKTAQGASTIRNTADTISLNSSMIESNVAGLNGISEDYTRNPSALPQPVGGLEVFYKNLWEDAKNDVRDYKRRYEDAIADKHKLDIELAGNKNSFMSNLAPALAGLAPMLMGGGVAPLAGTSEPQLNAPSPQPIQDSRIVGIVKFFATLDEPTKAKFYELCGKIFTDTSQIDTINEMI